MKACIMPAARKAEPTIKRELKSIRQQGLASFELIVVNHGSEDGTEASLQNASRDDPGMQLLANSQCERVSAARNSAIAIAEGDWIAVPYADDAFELERLESLISTGERLGLNVVIADLFMVDAATGHLLGVALPSNWMRTDADVRPEYRVQLDMRFSQEFVLGYCKPVFRRSSFLAFVERYNEKLTGAEDVILKQAIRLASKRFGLRLPTWDPRHMRTISAAAEQRLVQPRS